MSLCFCTSPATVGALCTHHFTELKSDLWKAPEILRLLDDTITGQAKQGGSGGGGGDKPDNFNEVASSRSRTLLKILAKAAKAGNPAPRGTTLTPSQLTARALSGVNTIARHPEAHDICQDLTGAIKAAWEVMDRADERRVLGQCRKCWNMVTTTKPRGEDGVVWCQACDTEYDVKAWDDEKTERARDLTATTTDLVAYFKNHLGAHVTTRTLQNWAQKEHFKPVGEHKPAQYRVGDVMDAWEEIKGKPLPGRKSGSNIVGKG